MRIVRELFAVSTPDSPGQRVQALAFELVVIYGVQADVFGWATLLPQQPGILATTGLARYVDVSFLLDARAANVIALCTCALLGMGLLRVFRGAYLLALISYHLEYVARYSLGKIGHASNVLGFALLALGAADLAFRHPTLRRRAATGFMLLLLSVGYTWAGLCKVMAAGFAWADGHHLWLWLREKAVDSASTFGDARPNKLQRLLLSHLRIATLTLALGLISELTSSLMIVRRLRRWVLLGLCAMHVGILYAMNIAFMNNIYVLLSMALPIAELVDAGLRRSAHAQPAVEARGSVREQDIEARGSAREQDIEARLQDSDAGPTS